VQKPVHRLRYLLIVLLVLIPLTLLAQELPPINPVSVTGDMSVGSVAVVLEPTQNLAVRFNIDGFVGNVAVTEVAAADGIQQFCNGQLDIVLLDRQITPQEASACDAAGRSPLGFRIGTKSLSVAVSPLNKFLDGLTTAELQRVFAGAPNWIDIRENFPTEVIGRFGPGVASAELNYFAQAVFGGDTNALTTALGAQYNDDANVALNGVAVSEFAIGIFDSSFLNTNRDLVRTITIDGVEPRFDTISNGTYPLARPLILYSATSIMQQKPQVAEFIKYYLLNLDLELPAVNLFPADIPTQQIAANTWLSAMGQPVVQPPAPVATEEVVIEPVPTEVVPETREPVSPFAANVIPLLISARTDLEVMATEVLGIQRPPGWSGSLDINDPQLPLLTRLDLELLAAVVYSESLRPTGWFGAVGSTQLAIVRDIRHDLEVMADTVFSGARPQDWAGGDVIYRCSRSTQALVAMLQRTNLYAVTADPLASDYCQQVEIEVSRYTEVNLVEGDLVLASGGDVVSVTSEAQITTEFAIAFLTRFAEPQVGIMPLGTPLTPVARSYTTGSNMTLIEGANYRVFIEFTNTDIPAERWELLPNIDEMEEIETFCEADWCR
jgi:phosphate transport system substrate-binding protein